MAKRINLDEDPRNANWLHETRLKRKVVRKMAKVSNETRLVIALFKEKMRKKEEDMKSYFGHPEENWAKGVIKGVEVAEKILAGIVRELEHSEK